MDRLPEPARTGAYTRLRRGEILIQPDPFAGAHQFSAPGALIHDWIGAVFVPGVSLRDALGTLQNYDRDAEYYRPQVLQSRLLNRQGNDFRVFLRLEQSHGITLAFDTEYSVRYTQLDAARACSRSYSTRIAEVENTGKAGESEKPPQDDRGFLWRLDSFWRFYETDGGVYIQCNAVSLTRDIPTGLGWLVRPFIEKIPRDSLHFTLEATRKVLLTKGHA